MSAVSDAAATAPKFAQGQSVRVRKVDSPGHIRTPHYVRGKTGVIERYVGHFKNPPKSLRTGAAACRCVRCIACGSCNPTCGLTTMAQRAMQYT